MIAETIFGVPKIENREYKYARAEYDQIATTSDASQPTKFRFSTPITVDTGKEYALVIMFDGSETFSLWTSKVGDFLINTKKISSGPSGKLVGKYFDYTNSPQNFNANNEVSAALVQNQYQSNWNALNDTDLKFKVYCARYAHGGFPVTSNSSISSNTQIILSPVIQESDDDNYAYVYPASCIELIIFSQENSIKEKFVGGQWAYQNTISWPGGRANNASSIKVSVNGSDRVTANSNYPNGAAFSWRGIYTSLGLSNQSNDSPYVVLRNGANVDVRRVISIVSNTIIQVEEPVSFINSAAEFMITPVGKVDSFNKSAPFGDFMSIVILSNSSANGSIRFVNNSISSLTVTNAGNAYSNSDVLYVVGYEDIAGKVEGGYRAVANITTNGNGAIQNVYFSNIGAGFVNANDYGVVISSAVNATPSNTSSGSGAVFSIDVGSSIYTELRSNHFANCRVADFAISEIIPYFDLTHPAGTSYDVSMRSQYYIVNDEETASQRVSYVSANVAELTVPIEFFVKNPFPTSKVPSYVSRSNEFVILYANGSPNDRVGVGAFSNVIQMVVNTTSNSDFLAVTVDSEPTISVSSHLINNSYVNEHTDQGSAWTRDITTKVNFARSAEDIITYLTAYRPANTDIQVFARLYNSTDSDYFEDKDWTRLEQDFTANLVSSGNSPSDFVELTYVLPTSPNTDFQANGTATLTISSANVIGAGSFFSTEIQAGDLVRIRNPLFVEAYQIDVVNAVTNATHMVLNNPISNVNFTGSGLLVDRIRTYKHQSFKNHLNSNVARYYNAGMAPIDTYDTYQTKLILLSDRPNLIPRVDDIRSVGVSA